MDRTKRFVESSGCRTRPLETSAYVRCVFDMWLLYMCCSICGCYICVVLYVVVIYVLFYMWYVIYVVLHLWKQALIGPGSCAMKWLMLVGSIKL